MYNPCTVDSMTLHKGTVKFYLRPKDSEKIDDATGEKVEVVQSAQISIKEALTKKMKEVFEHNEELLAIWDDETEALTIKKL